MFSSSLFKMLSQISRHPRQISTTWACPFLLPPVQQQPGEFLTPANLNQPTVANVHSRESILPEECYMLKTNRQNTSRMQIQRHKSPLAVLPNALNSILKNKEEELWGQGNLDVTQTILLQWDFVKTTWPFCFLSIKWESSHFLSAIIMRQEQ